MLGMPDETTVGRPLLECLGARVNHLVADLDVLRPARDEPPAQKLHAPSVLVLDDREHLLGWRDVESLPAAIRVGLLDAQLRRELLLDLVRLALRVREPTAHGRPTLGPAAVVSAGVDESTLA